MTLFSNRNERTRFFHFGIVGGIGSIIDFGVFNLLTTILKYPSKSSQMVSFSLAVLINFLLNRFWTFPDSKKSSFLIQFLQFSLISFVGLFIRTLIFPYGEKFFVSLAEKFIPHILTPNIVGSNLTIAFLIGIILFWNYFANRFWTFRDINH